MLHTKRGDFESFGILRAAYLEADDGGAYDLDPGPHKEDTWNSDKLHISKLGECPRAICYRLLGTPEKPRSRASAANRAVMFWAGYRLHHLTYSALHWAGILTGYEEKVELAEPWTGRCDAIIQPDFEVDEVILYDMKTVRPNALKYAYDMPKEKDCLQIGGYGTALAVARGAIEYADRAGQNTPLICPVDMAHWAGKARARMTAVEAVHAALPDLPDILPPRYVAHYRKARGKPYKELNSVTFEAAWECGYCDYHLTDTTGVTQRDSTCHPFNERPLEVAKAWDGSWRCTSQHEDAVIQWLSTQQKVVSDKGEEP